MNRNEQTARQMLIGEAARFVAEDDVEPWTALTGEADTRSYDQLGTFGRLMYEVYERASEATVNRWLTEVRKQARNRGWTG